MFEVTLGGAFLAGLLSFLSPCILPMVPFYLGYLAGTGARLAEGGAAAPSRGRTILFTAIFSAGIITIFVALGATASLAGLVLREWFDVLRWIAGGLIVLMGLQFMGVLSLGLLYREFRPGAAVRSAREIGLAGAYVMGLAFAFGWTPCVGPVLGVILFTAGSLQSSTQGALLLLAYGIGMTLPFVLAGIFVAPFMRLMRRFRQHLGKVEKATGTLLVTFGLLVATGKVNQIAQWMLGEFSPLSRYG
ncbi:cytochrome c biogenesis CcdA family protein [Profundibacterium mesophilum]|uniref:Cytochrome c-type biogenesis protein n=1 Tax=Profundibacterium mesophilum KAUST100406-0324 TaxID=1037889 RepID=A0A921NQ53_9RHOB|nr:cytochrome c biogenesis protein CcdA [Profundibacterium mesophilum]KAF0675275.1 Cytochrome c-type biogenesis protein [Profundibacterium mesophilum KAUST100406-0324]